MRDDLKAAITQRLIDDYALKPRGDWLQQGRCPECGRKELYAPADAPWLVRCGRENKCGAELHVKELYPDLFASWSKRYKVTKASPHAAADGYLREGRGFDLKRLKGTYTQESYVDHEKKLSTATVRFALAGGSYWERLIDHPERFGSMKARFAPGKSRAGIWWQLPDTEQMPETLWLAEGIFDAIALELNGIPARALLSSNNYPGLALDALAEQCSKAGHKRPVLVWALDHDVSGQGYTRKWVKKARDQGWKCKAAQIPPPPRGKLDWNDLHQRGKLGKPDIEEYLHQGALLLAKSADAKAALLFNRKRRWQFHFEFEQRLYWFKLEKPSKMAGADDDELQQIDIDDLDANTVRKLDCVREIANCHPTVLYYQANPITDEAWYYTKIESPYFQRPVKCTFTAGQRAVAAEFKKRLMHVAPGAVWTGSQTQLDRILRENAKVMRVETIDYIGYSREHGCYVFGDIAMHGGKLARLNDDDYFELGKLSIKTLSQSVALNINTERCEYRTDWVNLLWQCFGPKGIVALTFWFGSLFAEQIRVHDKSYPFLEIVGEAGSGKSTLVEFLWKLLGRSDYEGFDPNKSTHAARARNFAQVSNLPVVLIESDRDDDTSKARAFDWNELKTAYNGRSVRARGMKNNGNETYEPPFRAAIVIAQNDPVNASDAIIQRIVHLHFDKVRHTADSKPLAEQLERMPMEEVSGFILAATAAEKQVMETVHQQRRVYEDRLLARDDIKSVRIAKNHAQLMALADALKPIVGLDDLQHRAVHLLLEQMAIQRQQTINLDHPHVEAFWEQFEYLDGKALKNGDMVELDHSRDDSVVAINLVEYEATCTRAGIHPPCEMAVLKRLLRTSRRRKFIDMKTVNSSRTQRSVRCWVFQCERRGEGRP